MLLKKASRWTNDPRSIVNHRNWWRALQCHWTLHSLVAPLSLAQRGGRLLAKVSAKFVEDVAIIFTVRTDGRMAGFNLCPPLPPSSLWPYRTAERAMAEIAYWLQTGQGEGCQVEPAKASLLATVRFWIWVYGSPDGIFEVNTIHKETFVRNLVNQILQIAFFAPNSLFTRKLL